MKGKEYKFYVLKFSKKTDLSKRNNNKYCIILNSSRTIGSNQVDEILSRLDI